MARRPLLAAGACAVALSLAACGGSSSSSSSSPSGGASVSGPSSSSSSAAATSAAPAASAGALSIAAQPSGQLKFTQATLSAKAGTVTIDFTNKSQLPHNFTLQKGTSGPVVGATPTFNGGSRTLTVKLKPGTYTFFCSVPGHRTAGMQGTLTVS